MNDPVPMRFQTDCEVAALATVQGIAWEQARDLLDWKDLPGDLENPVFGNPANFYRAFARLELYPKQRTWSDLKASRFTPGKVLFLAHLGPKDARGFRAELENTLTAHWVVLFARTPAGHFQFWWGNGWKTLTEAETEKRFRNGWPNVAFEPVPSPWWWKAGRALWRGLKHIWKVLTGG